MSNMNGAHFRSTEFCPNVCYILNLSIVLSVNNSFYDNKLSHKPLKFFLMSSDDLNSSPLYDLARPNCLDEYIGQDHLVNQENGSVRNFMRLGYLPSMILHGPPGVGKTSLARILAQEIGYMFLELNATTVTVADLKEIEQVINTENIKRRRDPLKIVVFIDEIHRFTTLQQDNLLPYVESGKFVFIGATLVAPETRIRKAILSRCQLFQLRALNQQNLIQIFERALKLENLRRKALKAGDIQVSPSALKVLTSTSDGDARNAIKSMEFMSASIGHGEDSYYIDEQRARSIIETRNQKAKNESSTILLSKLFDSMYNIGYKNLGTKTQRDKDSSDSATQALEKPADEIKTQADENMPDPDVIKSPAEDIKTQIDVFHSRAELEQMKHDYEKDMEEFSRKKQKLWQSFPNLHGYTEEEMEFKIEHSDDSDFEDQTPLDLDEHTPKLPKLNIIDRFVGLSKVYLRRLLANGESESFILKKLLLFRCLYVETNEVTLSEFIACFKSFQYAPVNKIEVLEEIATKLTLCKKKAIVKRPEDLLWNLKLMKSYFLDTKNYDDTEKIIEPDIVFEDIDLQDYISDTPEKPQQFYKDLLISEYKLEHHAHLWS